jgi:hypothetical protein
MSLRIESPGEKKKAEPHPAINLERESSNMLWENPEAIAPKPSRSRPMKATFLDPILDARAPPTSWKGASPT